MNRQLTILTLFLCHVQFLFAQPANDLKENYLPFTLSSSVEYDSFDMAGASFTTITGSCYSNVDLWYGIKVPTSGAFRTRVIKHQGTFTPQIQYFTGSPSSSLTAYVREATTDQANGSCGSGDLLIRDQSIIGDSLFLRIYSQYSFHTPDSFLLSIEEVPVEDLPTNDTCESAIGISPSTTIEYDTFSLYNSTVIHSSPPLGTTLPSNEDVWFKTKMPANGALYLRLEKTKGTFNPYIQVFTGSCGSLSAYTCDGTCSQPNGTASGIDNLFIEDESLAGDSLFIRIYNNYNFHTPDSFRLSIQEILSSELVQNNQCDEAINIIPNHISSQDTFSLKYGLSSPNAPNTYCSKSNEDVWFKVKVPQNGAFKISTSKLVGTFTPRIQLFTGTCASLSLYSCEGSCNIYNTSPCTSDLLVRDMSLAGDTVFFRIYNTYNFHIPDSFTVSVDSFLSNTLPTYNDCSSAKLIDVYAGGCIPDTVTTINTTRSISGIECGNFGGTGHAWLKFAMPISDDVIISTTDIGYGHDLSMTAYQGSCGSLTKLSCSSSPSYPSISLRNLGLAGDTIFIMINSESGSSVGDSFALCVIDTVTPSIRSDTGTFDASTPCKILSGNQWIDMLDDAGDLVFSINPNNYYLGRTCYGISVLDSTVAFETALDTLGNKTFISPRKFYISPSTNPGTNGADIRLYIKKREMHWLRDSISNDGYNVGPSLLAFAQDSFKISKLDGSEFSTSGNNPISINPTVTELNDSVYQIEFNTTSFSKFIPSFSPSSPLTPLPVELLHIEAKWINRGALISWSTASETNSDYFEVQKWLNNTWIPVGQREASGQSQSIVNYSFLDIEPLNTNHTYYRLKQVDLDGKIDYSKSVILYQNRLENITVYPNPTNQILNVQGMSEMPNRVSILDIYGNELFSLTTSKTQTQINLESLQLTKTLYLLRVQTPQGITSKVFIYK